MKEKVLPCPGSLSTQIIPPCNSTRCFAMARPMFRAPPVIRAAFPSNSRLFSSFNVLIPFINACCLLSVVRCYCILALGLIRSGLGMSGAFRIDGFRSLPCFVYIRFPCSLQQKSDTLDSLDTPDKVFEFFQPIAAGLEVEKFWVLCLNRKNRLIKQVEVTSGTATSSLAHPREVFREAIRLSATAVVCVHNHPSGDPTPSADDCELTKRLAEAAKTVDISLLDHVIIGQPAADPYGRGYYSFNQTGIL